MKGACILLALNGDMEAIAAGFHKFTKSGHEGKGF